MIPVPSPLQGKTLTSVTWRSQPSPRFGMWWRGRPYFVQTAQLWYSMAVQQLNSFTAQLWYSLHSCEVARGQQGGLGPKVPRVAPLLPAAPVLQLGCIPANSSTQIPKVASMLQLQLKKHSIGLKPKSAFFEPEGSWYMQRKVPSPGP